jgi:hypothetical protein
MLHSVMVWASWAIGIVGIAGLAAGIAATIWLGPVVVNAIIGPIFSRFVACTKCVVSVVFVLSTIAAYWLGHHQAANECRDAELSAVLRNKLIDLTNAEKAKADETTRANTIEAESNDRHQSDLAEIAKLKSRPPTCAFDDFDIGGRAAVGVPDKRHGWPGSAKPSAGTR